MIIVDAHVHVYPCFDLALFFSSAYRNLTSVASELVQKREIMPTVILADWSRQSWFSQFKLSAERPRSLSSLVVSGWCFRPTEEEQSVHVENSEGKRLTVLAGKKIITSENLEVLALGTTGAFEDGLSLQATLEEIRRHQDSPIPVIPWAVGKWWGRRGKILESVMRSAEEPFFYLCDNGNRPFLWRRPSHFKLAEELRIRILAGSDPLHFRSEAACIGRYGFYLPIQIPANRPAWALKKALEPNAAVPIRLFGRRESADRFIHNQIRMQIFKKKWKKELLK